MKKTKKLHAGAVAIEHALKEYHPETDPLVLKKLEQWQNLKFGLLMHWAPSSQWGIVESWSLCSEDESWCKRSIEDYTEYKRQYEGLKKTFNPVNFNPGKWAEAASKAGMKYVVFTTKHHDGFCMYDSKFTNYKITDSECLFHSNPKANIAKEVFETFRKKGLKVGTYFSKPDWHSDYYWWQRFATPDRNPNYDITKYPERWQQFVEFTHNQINELMTEYGDIDILWMDGCWVRSYSEQELKKERKNAGFNSYRIQNQDINMPMIVKNARLKQPGLIVVDRAVPGPYQNYLTPENQVPDKVLPYPWEACMPMTPSWSYEPGLAYKPARTLIHLLVDIVAKGGNFLLNVAPTATGDYEDEAYDRLEKIAEWMKINGEAIYNSHPVKPYKEGKVCLTQLGDGTTYAIYLAEEHEQTLPEELRFTKFSPSPNATIELLGAMSPSEGLGASAGNPSEGFKATAGFTAAEKITLRKQRTGCVIEIPKALSHKLPNHSAWTLKIR